MGERHGFPLAPLQVASKRRDDTAFPFASQSRCRGHVNPPLSPFPVNKGPLSSQPASCLGLHAGNLGINPPNSCQFRRGIIYTLGTSRQGSSGYQEAMGECLSLHPSSPPGVPQNPARTFNLFSFHRPLSLGPVFRCGQAPWGLSTVLMRGAVLPSRGGWRSKQTT